jgi:hypothetical protein
MVLPNATTGPGESPLFGFRSLQRVLIEGPLLVQGGQPCHSSRFSVWMRSCGFWRHSSSSAAELFRAGDRGTELSIMRHRPHSRWRSAIGSVWPDLVGRSRASVKEADRPTTLLGFVVTLRSLVPASQVSFRSSRSLEPRLSFHERPPRVIFVRGIDRQICIRLSFECDRSRTSISTSGICHYPAASALND